MPVEERTIVAILEGNRIGITLWKEGEIWYVQLPSGKIRKAYETTLVPILQLWDEDKRCMKEIMKDPDILREIVQGLIERLPRDEVNRFITIETSDYQCAPREI